MARRLQRFSPFWTWPDVAATGQPPKRPTGRHAAPWRLPCVLGTLALSLLTAVLSGTPSAAQDSAVVLMYHRFGDSRHPSTNIRIDQFEEHISELRTGGYTIVPVPEIVSALRNQTTLPDKAVGITVDDAYLSVYQQAWPRFRAAAFPFTVFVATDAVDKATARGSQDYMNWEQLRELVESGVTIGSQTASHLHMPMASLTQNKSEIDGSNARFEEELGFRPTLFAYPYGEASLAVAKTVSQAEFVAAFGQHSGAIGRGQDLFYLPRFALNETYGDLDRLRLVANTLPLPVEDVTPEDHLITQNNPPAIGFTVVGDIEGLDRLNCFISPEKAQVERLGDHRFEIRVERPLAAGRTRLNCTAPGKNGRWHWYGRQFIVID